MRPEGPGYYRQEIDGKPYVMASWWNPGWPLPSQPDGSFRSPQDTSQLTVPSDNEPMMSPSLLALQGIKLLGAREVQNAGYRFSLVNRFLESQIRRGHLEPEQRGAAIGALLVALETWGRQLRDRVSELPQLVTFVDPEGHHQFATQAPDLAGPPHWLGDVSFELAEVVAKLLEEVGDDGRNLASEIREENDKQRQKLPEDPGADELWEFWQPWLPDLDGHVPVRHSNLLVALWRDRVRPYLERARDKPPALTRAIHAPVTALLSSPPVRHEESTGQRCLDLGLTQVRAVHVDALAAPYLDRGIELFQSIHAHKVLRHLVFESHRKAIEGDPDPRLLRYPGGYAALAKACGILGGDGATKVRAIVEAMSTLDVPLAAGHSAQLFAREFSEARGQRQAHLSLVVGTPLLPDCVFELQRLAGTHTLEARRAQDLIPLLPIPPTIGRPNDEGAQATLSLRVVAHLRDHAAALAQGRGAPMPMEKFRELALASRLSAGLAPRVLEHWLQDHQEKGPAFLKRLQPDHYTLGDAHKAERAFLESGGQRSLDSSEAGRRSAAKREAARKRVRKTPGK